MLSRVRAWSQTDRGRRRVRYVAASAASVVVGQLVLGAAFGVARWPARLSNFVAFVTATIVAFVLQRRWTWGRVGRARFAAEVVPFWIIAIVGLLASTWAVGIAEEIARDTHLSRAGGTVFVLLASLSAHGVLWVAKFVIFERYLFGSRPMAVSTQGRETP